MLRRAAYRAAYRAVEVIWHTTARKEERCGRRRRPEWLLHLLDQIGGWRPRPRQNWLVPMVVAILPGCRAAQDLLHSKAKPTSSCCSLFVEPGPCPSWIRDGETLSIECLRQGHAARRRKAMVDGRGRRHAHAHTNRQTKQTETCRTWTVSILDS